MLTSREGYILSTNQRQGVLPDFFLVERRGVFSAPEVPRGVDCIGRLRVDVPRAGDLVELAWMLACCTAMVRFASESCADNQHICQTVR